MDSSRKVIYINFRFREMWKLPADIAATAEDDQLFQYALNQLMYPGVFYKKVNDLYASPRDERDTILLKDGRIFEILSCPIINEAMVNGILWTFRDITEKKLAEDMLFTMLKRKVTIDSLTGLFNRQYFETAIAKALAHIKRYGTDTSLIMLDVDHFKAVNDNYGHDVGDKVLVELAKRCKTILRESDILARWGGEEFFIILPETDARAAGEAAEKLRYRIMSEPFVQVGKVTISLGVTGILSTDSKDSLLKRIDDALYESKHLGRNRVVVKIPPSGNT